MCLIRASAIAVMLEPLLHRRSHNSARPARATKAGPRTHSVSPVRAEKSRGRVSFAMAGKNTRSTQLFINFGDNRRLDKEGFARSTTAICTNRLGWAGAFIFAYRIYTNGL